MDILLWILFGYIGIGFLFGAYAYDEYARLSDDTKNMAREEWGARPVVDSILVGIFWLYLLVVSCASKFMMWKAKQKRVNRD